MKTLLLSLALLAVVSPAAAQTDGPDKAERARIAAEKAQVEANFSSRETACYKAFAVNDCLKAARTERRDRLAVLRRQELALNEAERKLEAAERLRRLEAQDSAAKDEEAAARRARTLARQAQNDKEAAERAAKAARPPREPRQPKTVTVPTPSASRAARAPPTHDTAKALQETAQRQQEAKERQERVAKRQAEAAKSGVKPLPAPE